MNTPVRGLVTDPFCYILDKNLLGTSNAQDLYRIQNPYQNLAACMKARPVVQNVTNSRFVGVNLIHTPTVYSTLGSLDPMPSLAQRAVNLLAVEQFRRSNCYVCNLGFPMQSYKEAHIKEFPHCIMAPMKSEMIKRGLEVEFLSYSRRKKTLTCTLCNVKMLNTKMASKHLNEESHIQVLNNWCAKFTKRDLPVELTQPYYCKICNVFLDGTTDASWHYKEEPHRLRVAQTRRPSNLTLPSSNIVNFVCESPASEPALSPATARRKPSKPTPNFQGLQLNDFTLISNETDRENNDCVSVKDQLFNEINKFVQTIYYSKALPLNVSLQYIKKVNEDVKKLIENYQAQEIDCMKSEDSVEDKHELSQEREAVGNIKFVSEAVETIDLMDKEGDLLPEKIVETAEHEAVLSRRCINSVEPKIVNEKPKTIVEMLQQVENEKSKLMDTDSFTMEINVLNEIEDLLKQMNQPKQLAEEILKYLKTFNESLDQEKFIGHDDEGLECVTSHECLNELRSLDTYSNISPKVKNLLQNQNVLVDSLNDEEQNGKQKSKSFEE
ncbi:uncharacterized protein [Euwallacea fornicatus]|uniref:uncharacterized protein n=1 Tax=Euwallacea fornicatus TaxID=995702 RepID=UPI00338F43F4